MKIALTFALLLGAALVGGLGWLWSSPMAPAEGSAASVVPVQGRSFLDQEPVASDETVPAVESPFDEDPDGSDPSTEDASTAELTAVKDPITAPGAHGEDVEKPTKTEEGHPILTWEDIAYYDYELPEPIDEEGVEPTNEQIPQEMMDWSGKQIGIEGHMVPLEVEDGRVHSFVHSRYFAGCCFGGVPMMNEWIEVDMEDPKGADYLPFSPILVVGTFEVGEVIDEYGYVSSIYRLKAVRVTEVE